MGFFYACFSIYANKTSARVFVRITPFPILRRSELKGTEGGAIQAKLRPALIIVL